MDINSKDISHNVCYDMSFYSFCFFPRHILFYHCDMLFLRSANRLTHNSVLRFFLLLCGFPLQETALLFPILLSVSLYCKNYILLNMADNHVVMLSTDSSFLPHTLLLSQDFSYDICFCFLTERNVLSSHTDYQSGHLDNLFFYICFLYPYYTIFFL